MKIRPFFFFAEWIPGAFYAAAMAAHPVFSQAAQPPAMPSPAATELQCPARMHVLQTAEPSTEEGWRFDGSNKSHPLVTVSFFAGPPEQKAKLVPSRQGKKGKAATATWVFEPSEQRYWVACEYGGTSATAARELPTGVTACTVEYDPAFYEPVMKRWCCQPAKP